MGCMCSNTTYLCLCRHRERLVEKCAFAQLRAERSCWACCFPTCKPYKRRYNVDRVCGECDDYFYHKYGKRQYKKMIESFISYKKGKGWDKVAIDPQTVPQEALLKGEPALPRIKGQPFSAHQHMSMTGHTEWQQGPANSGNARQAGISRRAPTPFLTEHIPSRASVHLVEQGGTQSSHETSHMSAHFSPTEVSNRKPPISHYLSGATHPPVDPSVFVVGDDEDGEEDDGTGHRSFYPMPFGNNNPKGPGAPLSPSPQPQYHGNSLPPGTVVPELAHLAQNSGLVRKESNIRHPKPQVPALRHVEQAVRNRDSGSDISIVKRLTHRAQTTKIPDWDYIELEGGIIVPKLAPAPRGHSRSVSVIQASK
ncbi:hypothetical protein F5Y19DRAFT_472090 [Xylariaceae sp. FL1651]|nr:hypothetical protein F5Y19DRAFT_472090 [Xylariaceae sp. FL1651]